MKKEYIKVSGHSDLVRDPETNSLINKNQFEYNEYITRKNVNGKKFEKIDQLESDMKNLKDDIDEIKNLLRRLANESSWRNKTRKLK